MALRTEQNIFIIDITDMVKKMLLYIAANRLISYNHFDTMKVYFWQALYNRSNHEIQASGNTALNLKHQ